MKKASRAHSCSSSSRTSGSGSTTRLTDVGFRTVPPRKKSEARLVPGTRRRGFRKGASLSTLPTPGGCVAAGELVLYIACPRRLLPRYTHAHI